MVMDRHAVTSAPPDCVPASALRNAGVRRGLAIALAAAALLFAAAAAHADARTQARRIHDRLAGVPPTAAVLDAMTADVAGGDPIAAANRAMEHRAFYDVTLKNFAMPWTNRDQTVFAPLNDYVATVIGMVRDNVPFDQVLYGDILYVGNASGLPPYSPSNNDHYEALERGFNLKQVLTRTTQSSRSGGLLTPDATAGVITSRAAAQAFFVAGTNRAMFRFTMLNHMCRDMEQVLDTTRPPDRIRQDVSRSPGGDSRVFLNNCIGCHSGMDPMAQAFAYYDWDEAAGHIVHTPGVVRPKYFNNDTTFKPGYATPDDHWDNYWRLGPNSLLGWDDALPGGGQGAKSLGRELAGSEAFARCQVEKVFRNVCFRAPSDTADRNKVEQITASFRSNNYRLKQVFAETAAYCMGD
jgi:hypothetical protein